MRLILTPLKGIPLVAYGDDLPAIISSAMLENGIFAEDGDILVIGQKIVSKAEGRTIRLADVAPGKRAQEIAGAIGKDPRLVELVLRESKRVVRARAGTIIVEHKLGFVCANAGIDHSNVGASGSGEPETVLLLPADPDGSALRIRTRLEQLTHKRLGILINDSHGRAWRLGSVGVSIGISGLPALMDERGWSDLFGFRLQSTVVGVADELAAAASLAMGQAAEGTPVVHVRGFPYSLREGALRDLLRPAAEDLFR